MVEALDWKRVDVGVRVDLLQPQRKPLCGLVAGTKDPDFRQEDPLLLGARHVDGMHGSRTALRHRPDPPMMPNRVSSAATSCARRALQVEK